MNRRKITVTGESRGLRLKVVIDGKERWLRLKAWKYLLRLCHARLTGDGWVRRKDFDAGYQQDVEVCRLEKELGIPGWEVFESNYPSGTVRLLADPKQLWIDGEIDIDDVDVERMVLEITRRVKVHNFSKRKGR